MYFHHFRCAEAGRECVSWIMSGVGGGGNGGACGYPSPSPLPQKGERERSEYVATQDALQIARRANQLKSRQALSPKIFRFSASGKSVIVSARLTANEGRSRSSRTCCEMRWTRELRLTSVARRVRRNRVVLTPDAGVKLRGRIRAATVAKSPPHRGEHGISRKATAQGRPECSR